MILTNISDTNITWQWFRTDCWQWAI